MLHALSPNSIYFIIYKRYRRYIRYMYRDRYMCGWQTEKQYFNFRLSSWISNIYSINSCLLYTPVIVSIHLSHSIQLFTFISNKGHLGHSHCSNIHRLTFVLFNPRSSCLNFAFLYSRSPLNSASIANSTKTVEEISGWRISHNTGDLIRRDAHVSPIP